MSEQTQERTHSPLPWSVEVLGRTMRVVCRKGDDDPCGDDVALFGDVYGARSRPDAEFICEAANSYYDRRQQRDELLAALKEAVATLRVEEYPRFTAQLRDLIRRVEGGQ